MPGLNDHLMRSIRPIIGTLDRWPPWLAAFMMTVASRLLPQHGEPERALIALLCDQGSTVVDVGANHGSYCSEFLRCGTTVIAVEPNPRMVAILRNRFRRAVSDERLTIMPVALSATEGNAILHIPKGKPALASLQATLDRPDSSSIDVECRTLDAIIMDQIDMAKIDVEGAELDVLSGARHILSRDKPALLIEAENRHNPNVLTKLRSFLEPMGYRGFYYLDGQLHPIKTFNADLLQNPNSLTEDGTLRKNNEKYINNFLFLYQQRHLDAISHISKSSDYPCKNESQAS